MFSETFRHRSCGSLAFSVCFVFSLSPGSVSRYVHIGMQTGRGRRGGEKQIAAGSTPLLDIETLRAPKQTAPSSRQFTLLESENTLHPVRTQFCSSESSRDNSRSGRTRRTPRSLMQGRVAEAARWTTGAVGFLSLFRAEMNIWASVPREDN